MLNEDKNDEQIIRDLFHDADHITWDEEPEDWENDQIGRSSKATFEIRGRSNGCGHVFYLTIKHLKTGNEFRSNLGFVKRHDARMAARWFANAYKRIPAK